MGLLVVQVGQTHSSYSLLICNGNEAQQSAREAEALQHGPALGYLLIHPQPLISMDRTRPMHVAVIKDAGKRLLSPGAGFSASLSRE